ncbi:MAG: RNA chaperone Hfq [Desulfurobacterium sp.]|nr:MAG: RNA chaperone Hfq [Desulfurobacterium sp.]
MNLQDTFLNRLRKEKIKASVYLAKGTKLEGIIRFFDTFTILLESGKGQTLIYKSEISTIVPERPIKDLFSDQEGKEKVD